MFKTFSFYSVFIFFLFSSLNTYAQSGQGANMDGAAKVFAFLIIITIVSIYQWVKKKNSKEEQNKPLTPFNTLQRENSKKDQVQLNAIHKEGGNTKWIILGGIVFILLLIKYFIEH